MSVLKNGLIYKKKGLFQGQKGQMGDEKYVLGI